MFRDLKEYQDITKIYQNNVYQSKEDIIKEAFASEEFTEEEAAFIEENFDALIEEVIAEEEESLSEQMTGRQRGKALRQEADKIISDTRKPAVKTTKVSSKAIQGKPAGVVGKFKSALSKVGSKIKDVAKTAVKTGAAPLKSGGAVSKMGAAAGKSGLAVKGAKVLSKMGTAGKLAAGAALVGGALIANRKKIKAAADKAKVDKYVANRKGDKPIEKIDAKQFDNRRDPSPESDTSSTPVVSDKTKQGKPRTKAQMMAAKRIASGKTIADVKKDNTDAMKAKASERNQKFQDAKKSGNLAQFRKDNPKVSGADRAKAMAVARLKKKEAMEEYTPYDMVLEYLLSSEQAATIEEANYVMTEMDAETIQGIVEEQKKNLDEGIASMALKTGAAVLGGVLAKKGIDKLKKFDPVGDARKKYQDKKATEYEKKSGTTKEDGYFR